MSRVDAPRASLRQRATVRALRIGVGLLRLLPDHLVYRSAYALGTGLSLVMIERRSLVRRNLLQVCRGLQASGLASEVVRRALSDGAGMDRLVRAAFGHWALAYAESALTTGYSDARLRARVRAADDAPTRAALAPTGGHGEGRIFVSPHFGCVELAARYAVAVAGLRLIAPMETVADPALQSYLEGTRGARGVTLIPIRGAATLLREALARGEGVALVADRAIGGSGVLIHLFGARVRLPLGPAVLALESGAPVFVVGVRRVGWGRWASRVEALPEVGHGTLRARIHEQLDAQARAFERIIADAPEQWWTILFKIWDDAALTPVSGERRREAA